MSVKDQGVQGVENSETETSLFSAVKICVDIDGMPLLHDVSLDVNKGEVVALVGPNGAGKTTFINAITGEQKLKNGCVQFNGRDLNEWDLSERAKHFAVLPQASTMNFPFTGREVVELARIPHATGLTVDAEIVDEVLEFIDAEYIATKLYPHLSGGEKQRIQLARSLAQIWRDSGQPRFLVLDEPSSYFDLAHQQMLVHLVRKLAKAGIGVLMVVHDLNMALSCADRTAVIRCGRIEGFGPTESILSENLIKEVFQVDAKYYRDESTGHNVLSLLNGSFK